MQPATTTRYSSSVVLKLGRYVARCLTAAQPDIWFLFLYKCGQLVTVNLHEPVARSVGILDELFQTQQQSACASAVVQQQRAASDDEASSSRPPSPSVGHEHGRRPSTVALPPPPPDNDQYRGMDEDDTDGGGGDVSAATDDGYADSDSDNPFVLLANLPDPRTSTPGRRYHGHRNTGQAVSRRRNIYANSAQVTGNGTGTYVRSYSVQATSIIY